MSLKNICKQGIGIGLTLLLESACTTISNIHGYETSTERRVEKNRERSDAHGEWLGMPIILDFKEDSYITSLHGSNELLTILGVYTGEIELWKKTNGTATEYRAYPPKEHCTYEPFSHEPRTDAMKRLILETDEDKDNILTLAEISKIKQKVFSKAVKESM
ncbi:MAG: hypothetical protein WC595_05900 [Candidatus Nanoarchaeia archaeon]